GLLFLSAPVLTISLAALAGLLTDRIGPMIPASIGLSVIMVGFAIGVVLKVDSHWSLPALLLACTGIGQGFFNTPNQTAIIGSVPGRMRIGVVVWRPSHSTSICVTDHSSIRPSASTTR